jgi:tRNA (guanine37-N1)-methyltransferase
MKSNLKAVLADTLTSEELRFLYKSYDIVGDIAVIRVPEPLKRHIKLIAKAVMQINKSVKTVLHQVDPVSGDFRLRKLRWVIGERKTEVLHKEYGCLFKIDLGKCYFSPRLSFERVRIAQLVQVGEVVINMFAGVGCYSIIIAKHSKAEKVYSLDINPVAVKYIEENARLNKVEYRVVPVEGDTKVIIEEKLQNTADRVLMPLPEKAYEYLDYAVLALKPTGGYVHYYGFEHATKNENSVEKVRAKLSEKLQKLYVDFEVSSSRVVRTTGPRWYQVVVDVKVRK